MLAAMDASDRITSEQLVACKKQTSHKEEESLVVTVVALISGAEFDFNVGISATILDVKAELKHLWVLHGRVPAMFSKRESFKVFFDDSLVELQDNEPLVGLLRLRYGADVLSEWDRDPKCLILKYLFSYPTCAECNTSGAHVRKKSKCTDCKNPKWRFCSADCYKKHWKRVHKFECKALTRPSMEDLNDC